MIWRTVQFLADFPGMRGTLVWPASNVKWGLVPFATTFHRAITQIRNSQPAARRHPLKTIRITNKYFVLVHLS